MELSHAIYHLAEAKRKIGILIVDDNPAVAALIKETLESTLCSVHAASSLHDAQRKIEQSRGMWHCWIVDINLGNGQSGLSLLERFPEFQYTVVLSGLKNMNLAFEAAKKGALLVMDITGNTISRRLMDEVYRIAVLGFMLNGKKTDYLDIFLTLKNHIVQTPSEWAQRSFIGLRHLQNICMLHTGLPPRCIIPLYYFLIGVAPLKPVDVCLEEIEHAAWKKHFDEPVHPFIESCFSYVLSHFDLYAPMFLIDSKQAMPY
jgi:CheY-like chemotaxis protein